MLVYAGIDEAGYGPMLGPLCIGCTAFVIPHHDPAAGAPNLWQRLNRAVCRSRRDRRNRIAVEDSKKLKGPNTAQTSHPLLHLERGVLSFLAAVHRDDPPADDDALLQQLGITIDRCPWYAPVSPLPAAVESQMLRIDIARVRRTLEATGVRCALLQARAIDAGPFNALLDRAGRKSAVNLDAAMQFVDQIWQTWPDDHPRVLVDRHGGRTHYREELQIAFPDARITVVAEEDECSRYRLQRDRRLLTISFSAESESKHLPVALASMTAKYVRELHMMRLNRFFTELLPGLKPTAGYVKDARRFVQDIEPVITRLGLARDSLVRRR